MNTFLLSVIIPVFNEEKNIAPLLERLLPVVKKYQYEIKLVINSTENNRLSKKYNFKEIEEKINDFSIKTGWKLLNIHNEEVRHDEDQIEDYIQAHGTPPKESDYTICSFLCEPKITESVEIDPNLSYYNASRMFASGKDEIEYRRKKLEQSLPWLKALNVEDYLGEILQDYSIEITSYKGELWLKIKPRYTDYDYDDLLRRLYQFGKRINLSLLTINTVEIPEKDNLFNAVFA